MLTRINTIYGNLNSWLKRFSSKNLLKCSADCCENEIQNNESNSCTLTESKLAERKNELQNVIFSRVINTKEIETGFIFSFVYEEEFLLKMTEYIITEKRCCPFFKFEIKLNQTNNILLAITGPLESKKMLEMFLDEN